MPASESMMLLPVCSEMTGTPPWLSHTHQHGQPSVLPPGWTSVPSRPIVMCTIPLDLSSVGIPTVASTVRSTASSAILTGSSVTPVAPAIASTTLLPSTLTTFLTSTVLLTSSTPETSVPAASGSPLISQRSDTGDPLLKVVIAVSVVALVAFIVLFKLVLKKQSPARYEKVIVYCPFHIIWSFITVLFAFISSGRQQNHIQQHHPSPTSSFQPTTLQDKSDKVHNRHRPASQTVARLSNGMINTTDRRTGEGGAGSRGRSRTERIQGLGIDVINPTPAEQPGRGRRLLRSISRSGNSKPFRMSFVSDHKSPRASDSSAAWRSSSLFSDEPLTPPQTFHSPRFNLHISDYSMASTFSDPSVEDLSTYHSNLARLKSERAERVRQMGLVPNDHLRVERSDPRRSGARKGFGLSPGKKVRSYLGASPVSSDVNMSGPQAQKSKFGHHDNRMGIDALKTWWDKLGSEDD